MKYYIDTCIWIDYWENRSDGLRPLGEFAFKFFSNLKEDDVVFYSNMVLTELNSIYPDDLVKSILSVIVDAKLTFIESDYFAVKSAEAIARTGLAHKSDALHIVLAKEVDAIFVTRDRQILLSGLIKAMTPEELI